MSSKKFSIEPEFTPLGITNPTGKIRFFLYSKTRGLQCEFSYDEVVNFKAFDTLFSFANPDYFVKMGFNPDYRILPRGEKLKHLEQVHEYLKAITNACYTKGIKGSLKIIRQGAFQIKDKIYFHIGKSMLKEDFTPCDFGEYPDAHLFVASAINTPLTESLITEAEALEMEQFFSLRCWDDDISSIILMGYLYFSMLCGMSDWNPHLSINGEPDIGKSSISKAVKLLLGDQKGCWYGSGERTTEAGVRGGNDGCGRAIVLDEMEGTQSHHKDAILSTGRQMCDGQIIRQATAIKGEFAEYYIPCTLMTYSIGPVAKEHADVTRFITLHLVKNKEKEGSEKEKDKKIDFSLLDDIAAKYFNEEFGARLRYDAYFHARTWKKLTKKIKNMLPVEDRAARNISPILAGYCCLMKRHENMEYIHNLIEKVTPTITQMNSHNKFSEKERFIKLFLYQMVELEIANRRYKKPLNTWIGIVTGEIWEISDYELNNLPSKADQSPRERLNEIVAEKLAELLFAVIKKGETWAYVNVGSTSTLILLPFRNTPIENKVNTILLSLKAEKKYVHITSTPTGEAKAKCFGWQIPIYKLIETPDLTNKDVAEFQ